MRNSRSSKSSRVPASASAMWSSCATPRHAAQPVATALGLRRFVALALHRGLDLRPHLRRDHPRHLLRGGETLLRVPLPYTHAAPPPAPRRTAHSRPVACSRRVDGSSPALCAPCGVPPPFRFVFFMTDSLFDLTVKMMPQSGGFFLPCADKKSGRPCPQKKPRAERN